MKAGAVFSAALAALVGAGVANAEDLPILGAPHDGGIDLQQPGTVLMREIVSFHNFILPIVVATSVLVLALLLWVVVRYNRRANPTPRKFTHNTTVEVIWTLVPVIILVIVASRSFPLLFHEERIPATEMTIKVTGNSWFWQYEYEGMGVNVTSNMLPDDDARAQGRPAQLAVDNPIFVPVGENVRVLITSNDVIHSWAVPAFGVKEDAIQGRVNDAWFNVDRPGIYFGQCSELCGLNHAFMPIEVHAVPRAEFERWVVAQGGSLASADGAADAPSPAQPAPQGAARADAPAR